MHRCATAWAAILALALAPLAAKAQSQAASRAVNDLALRLYGEVSKLGTSDNVFFSPLSISTAFSFVHLGAGGATRLQLEETFGFGAGDAAEALRKGRAVALAGERDDSLEFLLANRLFLQEGLELTDRFNMGAEDAGPKVLDEVDFMGDPEGARRRVNDFVSDKTKGTIEELMPQGSVTADTVLVIANAVFFQAAWKYPFIESSTVEMPFKGFNGGAAPVQMMRQKETTLRIGEILDSQILELPYEDGAASMLIVLPNDESQDEFSKLEANLMEVTLEALRGSMNFDEVDVYLPRFGIEDTTDLKAILPKLGVTDLFKSSADLSGIISTETPPLRVSSALHKAKILVDEKGTVAAGATSVAVVATSASLSPPKVFMADHPFVYFLIDEGGTILFMGNVRGLPA
ncbi:unnamed protein product [Ostreobium quekettii]|uniref:Serpin domain-containing protein n=1 Tax=Ostreobium quekettii TaxID=121088 RepID=A0A8S1J0F1_9CHLO|nr:unnamed protein product [Ostreobium quekettii]|eukprot:evm.model.scf_65.15 EVM.evm.TU.scf_65.15   scf_65:109903-111774(-)